MNEFTPNSFQDAISSSESTEWKKAIQNELQSLKNNKTWEIVTIPKDKKPIGCRWIFKKKYDENGNLIKHKARLVAKGYSQRYGVDSNETYAPVAKLKSIRTVVALAALYNMKLHQMDVTTAFLNGTLKEGVESKGEQCCLLKKSLYGLKQAPREWNSEFNTLLCSLRFQQSRADECIYKNKDQGVILAVYVDNVIIGSQRYN
jgi:hypothetical protein